MSVMRAQVGLRDHDGVRRGAERTAAPVGRGHSAGTSPTVASADIKVAVLATDPVTQAGLEAQLRAEPGIVMVEPALVGAATVALVCADAVDERAVRVTRAVRREGPQVVLVATELDETDVATAVEAGAVGLLRRSAASAGELAGAVRAAAAGDGVLAPDLLGRLLRQVQQVHAQVLAPRGLTLSGLSVREQAILRLISEGCDTREIARQLAYSERMVKKVLQDVTHRFGLRNRSHAVAYALRQGLI
jgi:DNA-binding NarL/FixJ family response regulator